MRKSYDFSKSVKNPYARRLKMPVSDPKQLAGIAKGAKIEGYRDRKDRY